MFEHSFESVLGKFMGLYTQGTYEFSLIDWLPIKYKGPNTTFTSFNRGMPSHFACSNTLFV